MYGEGDRKLSECKHEHTVKMFNYDINDNAKSWIQCVDCNTNLEDLS